MTTAIKLGLSLALLAALLYWVDVGAILHQLAQTDPLLVLAALGCLLLAYIVSALRWAWLARGLGIEVSLRRKIRVYFVGAFSSLFLPSTIGGDVVRGVLLAKGEGRNGIGVTAAASVVLDRLNGLYALVAVVTVCLPWFDWPSLVWWGWMALVAGMLVVMLGWPWLHRRLPSRLGWLARLPLDGDAFRKSWLMTLPLSLVVQLLMVQIHFLLGLALGLSMSWLAYGVMVGLVALMAILPISLNGFGVREAGYVGFVLYFGGSEAQGGALAALWLILMTVAALPGLWTVWQLGGIDALRRLTRNED